MYFAPISGRSSYPPNAFYKLHESFSCAQQSYLNDIYSKFYGLSSETLRALFAVFLPFMLNVYTRTLSVCIRLYTNSQDLREYKLY